MQNVPSIRHAGDRSRAGPAHSDRPTLVEMVGEVLGLSVGLGIVLLPLLLTALPGLVLFLLAPAVLLLVVAAAPIAIAGAIAAPPYLLVRFVRRRRGRTP